MKTPTARTSYGIGEWYGRLFCRLSADERLKYSRLQFGQVSAGAIPECPFRSSDERVVPCTKGGGVCSLRQYQLDPGAGLAMPVGPLVTTCPHRFEQDGAIYTWAAEVLLGTDRMPLRVSEVPFLERVGPPGGGREEDGKEDVGRLDCVLVHPDYTVLKWCALEKQAVYFSGAAMSSDFKAISMDPEHYVPAGRRRPDYRSSGPKRLMPQLQIKVPCLRRWGKRIAVVVDEAFFAAMGPMSEVEDVTNCDIAWLVVGYDCRAASARLLRQALRLTTLESAVEGLTAGKPVSLNTFEERIRARLAEVIPGQATGGCDR